MRRRKKNSFWGKIAGSVVISLAVILLFSTASAAGVDKHATIKISAKSEKMYQEQAIPALTLEVSSKDKGDLVLNPKTKYTLQDLMEELKAGKGVSVACASDGLSEGDFPITVELSQEIQESLDSEWLGKVKIEVTGGTLTVKNKYGEWDGEKFIKPDGTYVKNDFVTYGDKTYYFGDSEEKMTGWQDINSLRYCFDKKGVMKKGWIEESGAKYYLNDSGAMTIGWLSLEDARYYFDKEGKMVTGEQKIGTKTCVFAKDGKLESETGGPDPERPMMALTFDDGPGPRTMELLEVLEQNNAHATFFMQGKNAINYGDAIKKMEAIGCELGNHSYDHPLLTKIGADAIKEQMNQTNSAISSAVGHGATVMRPPYGGINDTVKANVGLPMLLWSVDTLDWKTKSKDATVASVLNSGDGDVVLMHDIHSWSVDAAIEAIPQLIQQGYQLVTVSELAEARGLTMENGGKYSEFWKK